MEYHFKKLFIKFINGKIYPIVKDMIALTKKHKTVTLVPLVAKTVILICRG